jgi:KAP family P-loop domain
METEKNSTWSGDLLNREADARVVIDFTIGRVAERAAAKKSSSYVMNVDAGWGQGKTFFLHGLQRQLKEEGYLVAYVNAWEDDHADDPLVAVMKAMQRCLPSQLDAKGKNALKATGKTAGRVALTVGKSIGLQAAKRYLGESGLQEVLTEWDGAEAGVNKATEQFLDAQADAIMKSFDRSQDAISAFKKSLRKLAEKSEDGKPIYILVDELDRCRPLYAIALLERVKHIFNVDGVVFVVATDTEQLHHAVKAVYGEGFDARAYLRRFFDRTYRFGEPPLAVFVEKLFADAPLDTNFLTIPERTTNVSLMVGLMEAYALTLRDAEQIFDVLRSVATLWPHQFKNKGAKIQLLYLLGLICLQHKSRECFDAVAKGDFEGFKRLGGGSYMLEFRGSRDQQRGHDVKAILEFMGRETYQKLAIEILREETKSDGGLKEWLQVEVSKEFQERFCGQIPHGSKSLLVSYPELVRTAGRLMEPSNERKE